MSSMEDLLRKSILEFEADSMHDLKFDSSDFTRSFIRNEYDKDEFEIGMLSAYSHKSTPNYYPSLNKIIQLELSTDFEEEITNPLHLYDLATALISLKSCVEKGAGVIIDFSEFELELLPSDFPLQVLTHTTNNDAEEINYMLKKDFLSSTTGLKLYSLSLREKAKVLFEATLFGVTIRRDKDLN